MTINLSSENLGKINAEVAQPSYQLQDRSAGIVHVGVGNFHRAHQSVYMHRLFECGLDLDWAIVGAGITHYDVAMREKLEAQDWLTTVVELDPKKLTASVIGSMVDFVEVDPHRLVLEMTKPEIRIVSLTVTEGGYYVDATTGGFDDTHPDIVKDSKNPTTPGTVFGIIIAALILRRELGVAPFTVLSCDNLPENGLVAKNAVLGLARKQDEQVAQWIEQNVAFPNSMVDCITPATGEREIAIVTEKFLINDSAPVVCEPFRQWVLEDNFPAGRPALEKVGVEFVKDVAPYELMKLRILNGGHAAIAYLAGLLDIHYVHDAMNHSSVTRYLEKLELEEIIPTLEPISGVDYHVYYNKIVERFSNEAVGDTIPRLCFDGLNRQPKFILPVISARLQNKQSIDGLALECALWCRYCFGTTDSGQSITPNDTQWDRLNEHAIRAKDDPAEWLKLQDVYGTLSNDKLFIESFSLWLNRLWEIGTVATIEHYLSK